MICIASCRSCIGEPPLAVDPAASQPPTAVNHGKHRAMRQRGSAAKDGERIRAVGLGRLLCLRPAKAGMDA